jgi:hypothetical protein
MVKRPGGVKTTVTVEASEGTYANSPLVFVLFGTDKDPNVPKNMSFVVVNALPDVPRRVR